MKPELHQSSLLERVWHGRPAAQVLAEEMERCGARRAFLISTASLEHSPALRAIEEALGERCVGRYCGVRAHAPRPCVIEGAVAATAARADLLVAVGGGSVIDAAKVMLLAMRHGLTDAAQLDAHVGFGWAGSARLPQDHVQWRRLVAVPTTFSAAEYTAVGGATEPVSKAKQGFTNPLMIPVSIVNDPELTRSAPLALLLSTGMKAVDHAVERVTSNQANLYSDTVSLLSLKLLARGLPALASDPDSLAVRQELQYGTFLSMAGSHAGVRCHLSHAIGHAVGSLCDLPHGHTTGILLPHVLRWLGACVAPRLAPLSEAMGAPGTHPADALAALVKHLGLPSRLRDGGVERSQLDTIAQRTLRDPLIANCPRPVATPGQVLEVLELAW